MVGGGGEWDGGLAGLGRGDEVVVVGWRGRGAGVGGRGRGAVEGDGRAGSG